MEAFPVNGILRQVSAGFRQGMEISKCSSSQHRMKVEVLVMENERRYAWPTDGAFHRGYVDGLQGRAKRTRQGEEYEDGYACGCGDAAPDAADRHVRAAMTLESRYGGDDLAAVSAGFEMGYDDACGHFAYASPTRLLGNVHAELAAALRENYLHGYAAGMSVLRASG